jgi:glycosyltransferase involved in cell wall biosynthesis
MGDNQGPKILIFSTAYFPLVGGAEIAVKEITDRIKDFQFDMITAKIRPNLAKFERHGQVNVYRYRVGLGLGSLDKFLLPIFGFIKAIRLDKKRNYQLIWSIMASQAGVAAAFFKIFQPSKKLLLTLQEGDPEEHLKRYTLGMDFLYKILIKPWHSLPFKKADYLTVISNYLKKRALENKVKVSIEVVPNGVDLEIFNAKIRPFDHDFASQDHGIARSDLGIEPDEKIIITVSRLVKKNGLADLIKAGQYLDFSFKILIIGTGPEEKKLRKLVKKLNLKDKVIFLGHIEYQNLINYYYIADVFVRSSLSEGLGNVFLEAMATGLPIIGTPVGGIPDFLIDRKTGLFCQIKNPQSIAQKIKEILEDDNLRKHLAKNGLRLVREKYDWDKISQKMNKIYHQLV